MRFSERQQFKTFHVKQFKEIKRNHGRKESHML